MKQKENDLKIFVKDFLTRYKTRFVSLLSIFGLNSIFFFVDKEYFSIKITILIVIITIFITHLLYYWIKIFQKEISVSHCYIFKNGAPVSELIVDSSSRITLSLNIHIGNTIKEYTLLIPKSDYYQITFPEIPDDFKYKEYKDYHIFHVSNSKIVEQFIMVDILNLSNQRKEKFEIYYYVGKNVKIYDLKENKRKLYGIIGTFI